MKPYPVYKAVAIHWIRARSGLVLHPACHGQRATNSEAADLVRAVMKKVRSTRQAQRTNPPTSI